MIFLLLVLYLSPEGQLDVRHVDTFGSRQHCMEAKDKVEGFNPPAGTKLYCLSTKKTKGMMIDY